jgi:N-acyl-D-aspartate/D-glutamate deacylase
MTKSNETYDVVLANGRVIDPETYLDAQMHVGIKGGRIAAVSESPLKGQESHRRLGADRRARIHRYAFAW